MGHSFAAPPPHAPVSDKGERVVALDPTRAVAVGGDIKEEGNGVFLIPSFSDHIL
jgi:hypothetical protein